MAPTPCVSKNDDDRFGALSQPFSLGNGHMRGVVKDNFDIAGLVTTLGSQRLCENVAATDNAEVVSRLLTGDVRLVGKARMHELAYGVTGINQWSGTPVNPAAADRIPGGSSSGCAVAIASDLADFAIGTDTGGSIRLPAACCEVVGLKSTFGAISRVGVQPASSSLDCVGVMARDVATIAKILALILPNGVAPPDQSTRSLHVVRPDADDHVLAAFDHVIECAGLQTSAIALPTLDDAFRAGLTIIGAEMWRGYSWLAPDFDGIGEDVAERLRRAASIRPEDVAAARAIGAQFAAEVDRLLGEDAFIVLPTLPCPPPLLTEAHDTDAQLRLTRFVRPFNVSGHPAITLPLKALNGRSAAVQIVGWRGRDAELCAFANTFQARCNQDIGVNA